jgi:AbrB family looped-hinge helix DNA binding protein
MNKNQTLLQPAYGGCVEKENKTKRWESINKSHTSLLIGEKMPTKNVGPKGQVVIPKRIRKALGLKPGVDVSIELRGDEIVISKPKIEGSYTEYYASTQSAKLKEPVDIKKIITEEVTQRHALH